MQFFVDEIRSNLQINPEIDCSLDLGQDFSRLEFLDRPLQHLTIKIEADRFDMTVLLSTQQIAGPAQLQIQSRNSKARPQFAEFSNRGKAATCNRSQSFVRRNEQVRIGPPVGSADTAAQL